MADIFMVREKIGASAGELEFVGSSKEKALAYIGSIAKKNRVKARVTKTAGGFNITMYYPDGSYEGKTFKEFMINSLPLDRPFFGR